MAGFSLSRRARKPTGAAGVGGSRLISRALARFRGNETGTSAIEFGLVAGPTLLTLCAILGIGLNFFMVASMDHAMLVGARAISTGAVSSAGMSASTFKQTIICPALPSLFTCSDVFVNATVVASGKSPSGFYALVNTKQSALIQPALDATKNSFCPGAANSYVVLEVLYPAPILFAFLSPATPVVYNNTNVTVLMSSTTFLTEPYSGARAYPGC